MPNIALVLLSIGDRIEGYRSITEPFWRQIANRLRADLNVLTQRIDSARKHAGWQKLLLPTHFAAKYDYVIYADVDILPHPATPLDLLLTVPAGKIGMCPAKTSLPIRPKHFYTKALDIPLQSVSNITEILNSGLIVWRTSGSQCIQRLFENLYADGKQHCGEQTVLSWAVQQQEL